MVPLWCPEDSGVQYAVMVKGWWCVEDSGSPGNGSVQETVVLRR